MQCSLDVPKFCPRTSAPPRTNGLGLGTVIGLGLWIGDISLGADVLMRMSYLILCKSQIPLRYLVRSWFDPDSVMEFGFKR